MVHLGLVGRAEALLTLEQSFDGGPGSSSLGLNQFFSCCKEGTALRARPHSFPLISGLLCLGAGQFSS